MNVVMFGALLLLVGGLINTVPQVAGALTSLFGGTPIIQIVIGAVSAVVGLVLLVKRTVLS